MSDYGGTPPPPPPPPLPFGGYGVQAAPPPNYLVWAILSTIFCFLPLGIVSIVFSAQVNSKWATGDVAGAQRASELAKKLTIWTVVAGSSAVSSRSLRPLPWAHCLAPPVA